jgi:hypothetical protein
VSRTGEREATATCSTRSMSWLNAALRVSMPLLRNDCPSTCSFWKREAKRS